jgi:hypothetical protein
MSWDCIKSPGQDWHLDPEVLQISLPHGEIVAADFDQGLAVSDHGAESFLARYSLEPSAAVGLGMHGFRSRFHSAIERAASVRLLVTAGTAFVIFGIVSISSSPHPLTI